MLTRLFINNFTVFREAEIRLSRGLNVIVGENASGKSHLLKLCYTICNSVAETSKRPMTKETIERYIAEKLVKVFRPDNLGRLATRVWGKSHCEVEAFFGRRPGIHIAFSFSTGSTRKVKLDGISVRTPPKETLFIPPKEVLTIYPGFAAAIENRELEFDDTYYDLCKNLDVRPLKGPRMRKIASILNPIENIMKGKVCLEKNNRFYFSSEGKGLLEVTLLAEGFNKVGMLSYLLRNGSLVKNGILLWDEPEANLNPKLLKQVAEAICTLVANNIQVIIATHSLFLMRELHILSNEYSLQRLFSALVIDDDDGLVKIHQDSDIDNLPKIVALEEEVGQSDRYLSLPLEG